MYPQSGQAARRTCPITQIHGNSCEWTPQRTSRQGRRLQVLCCTAPKDHLPQLGHVEGHVHLQLGAHEQGLVDTMHCSLHILYTAQLHVGLLPVMHNTHTYTQLYIHKHTDTHTQTQRYTHIHTHMITHLRTHIHLKTHIYKDPYIHIAELQIVFRYHGPNDPWLCKMMGQFSKGWVNDNFKCTHLQY